MSNKSNATELISQNDLLLMFLTAKRYLDSFSSQNIEFDFTDCVNMFMIGHYLELMFKVLLSIYSYDAKTSQIILNHGHNLQVLRKNLGNVLQLTEGAELFIEYANEFHNSYRSRYPKPGEYDISKLNSISDKNNIVKFLYALYEDLATPAIKDFLGISKDEEIGIMSIKTDNKIIICAIHNLNFNFSK